MAISTIGTSSISGLGYGFKNRIINGAMSFDQRYAGASSTPTSGNYFLDRWQLGITVASKVSIQQNAGSITPPSGFVNYLGVTSTSAYSIGASERIGIFQPIEGTNIADLGWGTVNAQTITISFWVRSSLTGTFGGVVANGSYNRCYVYSYSINAANTWEYKTVTIPGDQSGTWLTTNGVGIAISFAVAVGSSLQGAAGSWSGTTNFAPTGQVNVAGTNGATFYVTGVQFEKGSTATSFDYRPYDTEFVLCQRYYQTYAQPALRGTCTSSSTGARLGMVLPVVMRTTPTASAGVLVGYDGSVTNNLSSVGASYSTTTTAEFDLIFASSTFTTGRPCSIIQSGTASLTLSAEL